MFLLKTKVIVRHAPDLFPWALFLVGVAILMAPQSEGAVGSWQKIANFPYSNPGPMLLLPDGTVMVQNESTTNWYGLKPDNNGHYLNGNWSTFNGMNDAHELYAADVLQDGRVFVAGGEIPTVGRGTAEIFNPQDNAGAGSWTYINPPLWLWNPATNNEAFSDSDSVLLSDGTVLVAPVYSGEGFRTLIYNPSMNSWTNGAPSKYFQDEATWVKLPDDSILTIDPPAKQNTIYSFDTSERYIPSLKAWIPDTSTPTNYYSSDIDTGSGFMMADGRALFFGGNGHTVFYTPTGNTNKGSWTPGPDMPFFNGTIQIYFKGTGTVATTNYTGLMIIQDAPAAMMNNGKILCMLSFDGFYYENHFYEFDPTINNFVPAPSPTNSTPGAPFCPASTQPDITYMLDLPDGTVLFDDTGSLYIYTPDNSSSPLSAGKPTISSVSWNMDGSLHLSGTLFNGISQGASYGDDAQMDSNYPLVRFTDSNSNVYYGRSHNWSSTSVQTGSRVVSTECVLPLNVYANGPATYSLQVVANGNVSDPVNFYGQVWVDFNYSKSSPQMGTFAQPFSTLAQGTNAVVVGGTISIKPGHSPETMKISKQLKLTAVGGIAVIGK
jgi:hypothetical protein